MFFINLKNMYRMSNLDFSLSKDFNTSGLYTVKQVCTLLGLTRQGIYLAIRNKRLKSRKVFGRYIVIGIDLLSYVKNKYSRALSHRDGKLLFPAGTYSCGDLASVLQCPTHVLYYLVYRQKIPFQRKGSSYIFNKKDIPIFKEAIDCIRKKRISN